MGDSVGLFRLVSKNRGAEEIRRRDRGLHGRRYSGSLRPPSCLPGSSLLLALDMSLLSALDPINAPFLALLREALNPLPYQHKAQIPNTKPQQPWTTQTSLPTSSQPMA